MMSPIVRRYMVLQRRRAKHFPISYFARIPYRGEETKVKVLNIQFLGVQWLVCRASQPLDSQ